jgi:serine protein kinase
MSESIFSKYKQRYETRKDEEMSIQEYLHLCKEDSTAYAKAAERMLMAIGDPVVVDTREDERLSRLFMNRKIKTYPTFSEFYGWEEVIENVVSFFRHAAQGLEEEKQVLYLLGPVGGGKSSLAEKLKKLIEKVPFYTLEAYNTRRKEWEVSPVYEPVLGLFDKEIYAEELEATYGISPRYLGSILSPWAVKRLKEVDGDITKFKVVKVWPSVLNQRGVTKVEPGDENNQDISALVGKINIREMEFYNQNDPDAYTWAGGLNVTTQGLMEFVEMFKAPIKMLHPMITATQEGHYNGTEQFGAIPFQGILLAHSNESEWASFRNNKNNEAFLDRISTVKVPYTMRYNEEVKIYEKLIRNSKLHSAPCAPSTLEMMAQFSCLTRMKEPENSQFFSKLKVYNGESMKDKDPSAKAFSEYREYGGVTEGMDGFSTRQAFKILSRVFNYDGDEIAANPVHLMFILEKQIQQEQYSKEQEDAWIGFIKGILAPRYSEFIGDEIQKAYLESYGEYGQNLFDRYIQFADFWIQDQEYRDPDTGEAFDRENLNEWLESIEKSAGISNPKDFRNEVVGYVLRAKASNQGKSPEWTSYEKLRNVIEKKMFSNTEELLPVISFGKKATTEEQQKHDDFVDRMMENGHTAKQVRLLVEWYLRYKKHH